MMWVGLAFLSALLLGFYDVFKKLSLSGNAVIPVLCLSTLFSSLFLLPLFFLSQADIIGAESSLYTHAFVWEEQKYYLIKAFIVMSSWICGYIGIKYLPLTIVGPINATRPIMVLLGALLLLGERLNLWQWLGVTVAFFAFLLLSYSGKKEGIDFRRNRWIICVVMANIFGAVSALFDRWLLSPSGPHCDKIAVQLWNNIYQCIILVVIILIMSLWKKRRRTPSFTWRWSIIMISVSLSLADFMYFWALSHTDAMISVVSMIRRSGVIVAFVFGAMIFKEKNLRSKAIDLALVLLSMFFLFVGSK